MAVAAALDRLSGELYGLVVPHRPDAHGFSAHLLEDTLHLLDAVHLLPVDVRDDVALPQSTVPGRGAAALRAGHLGKAHHHYAVGKEFDAHRAAHGDHRPLLRGPGRRYQ